MSSLRQEFELYFSGSDLTWVDELEIYDYWYTQVCWELWKESEGE